LPLPDWGPADLEQLILASTTHPYDDRQNAADRGQRDAFASSLRVLDFTGSQRAGTSALDQRARRRRQVRWIAAAEHRLAKAASPQEMH